MTSDAMLVVKTLFSTIWSIFTSWHIPGTNVTPMAMALFLIVACLGLRFLYSLLGMTSLDSVSGLVADEHARENSRNNAYHRSVMGSIRERNAAARRERNYDSYHGIHHRDMP